MMKKLLPCLLALLLWLPLAQAETPPYAEATVLSVWPLTASQKALVDFLYQPVMAGVKRVELPEGTWYDDVRPAVYALMKDYPELFHLDKHYTIHYYTDSPEIATAVSLTYRMPQGEAAYLRGRLYQEAWQILAESDSLVDVHDRLLARVTYGGHEAVCHNALGPILYGEATCEGYTQALSLLYRMGGVPCGLVEGLATDSNGETERHAWNIVNLNGCMYIDATWNDQDGLGVITHWYYGLSSEQLAASHQPDGDQAVPLCTDHAEWYRTHGLLAEDLQDAYNAVYQLVQQGGMLKLRMADDALYALVAEDVSAFLDGYNDAYPDDGFYGRYTYSTNAQQRGLILWRTEE